MRRTLAIHVGLSGTNRQSSRPMALLGRPEEGVGAGSQPQSLTLVRSLSWIASVPERSVWMRWP